ncbi:hypothetical protein EDD85DRAFT_790897 [Armillaria nabsnona]|nr:hypothetical protein EDD85DRAFT_790897 [Armillaria nabsnona]
MPNTTLSPLPLSSDNPLTPLSKYSFAHSYKKPCTSIIAGTVFRTLPHHDGVLPKRRKTMGGDIGKDSSKSLLEAKCLTNIALEMFKSKDLGIWTLRLGGIPRNVLGVMAAQSKFTRRRLLTGDAVGVEWLTQCYGGPSLLGRRGLGPPNNSPKLDSNESLSNSMIVDPLSTLDQLSSSVGRDWFESTRKRYMYKFEEKRMHSEAYSRKGDQNIARRTVATPISLARPLRQMLPEQRAALRSSILRSLKLEVRVHQRKVLSHLQLRKIPPEAIREKGS